MKMPVKYKCGYCHREEDVRKKLVLLICPACQIEMEVILDERN